MKTFDEVYQIVEESSNECAFNREECLGMWELALSLPKNAMLFEIGVQYGRSSTVLALAATEKNFQFIATDSWQEGVSSEAREHILNKISRHNLQMVLWDYDSEQAERKFVKDYPKKKLDLVHIDGDHTYPAVKKDIELWLPKVKVGGYALFDDYGHDSLPDVFKACSEYFDGNDAWEFVARYGNKLGVFKRVK